MDEKKPCVQCGELCDILHVQLGDTFTLTYLRVCGAECMFLIAYDFIYELGEHKSFHTNLYEKQNAEDKVMRDAFVKKITDEFIKDMGEHFKVSPNLLTYPMPECMKDLFHEPVSLNIDPEPFKYVRPSKEDRIKWQKEHVERVNKKLEEALQYLEKIEKE